MKVMGVTLKDCGKKMESPAIKSSPASTDEKKVNYPTLSVGEGGYNGIKVDLDGFKAGQKVVLVAICNIAEITERKEQTEKETKEECNGRLEILSAGLKPHTEDIAGINIDEVSGKANKILDSMDDDE